MGAACGKNKSGKKKDPSKPENPKPEPNKGANTPVTQPGNTVSQPITNPQGNANPNATQKVGDPNLNIQSGSNTQQVQGQQQSPVQAQPVLQLSGNTDPKEPIVLKQLYLFGIDSDESSKILRFNPQQKSVETIRPPSNLELFNLSGIVYLNDKEIFLTGGANPSTINPNTIKASNSAYLYNAQANTATVLPAFNQARWSHIAVIFKNKLFIIGGYPSGAGDDNTILKSVEFLPLNSSSLIWTKSGDLVHPRVCSFSIIYADRLYVVGGFAGNSRRPKQIEVYNEEANKWELSGFKLPKGIEYPVISTAGRDELLVIGGNVRGGVIRSNILLNFKTKSYSSKRSMHKERVFHKGIQVGSEIWVFGGEEDDTVEVYDSIRDEWRFEEFGYNQQLKNIRSFSAALAPFVVLSKKDLPEIEKSKSNKTDTRGFLFGDDKTPFILEINFSKKFTKEKPLPIGLKLFAYQGVVSLEDGRYFLCKGHSQHGQHPVANAYIYDPDNNEVKKCSKSKIPSYASNVVKKGNHVYVIGGQSWKDDQEILLDTCERYDIQNDTWETLPRLNHERCSAMSFVWEGRVAILGGFRGNYARWDNAEVFNEDLYKWEVVNLIGLPPLEGAGVLRDPVDKKSILIFQGVTNEYESLKVWKMSQDFRFQELRGSIKDKREFAKVCAIDNSTVCLLGGERLLVEFFDLQKSDNIQNDFSMEIESALTKMIHIDGQPDKSLKNFSFA